MLVNQGSDKQPLPAVGWLKIKEKNQLFFQCTMICWFSAGRTCSCCVPDLKTCCLVETETEICGSGGWNVSGPVQLITPPGQTTHGTHRQNWFFITSEDITMICIHFWKTKYNLNKMFIPTIYVNNVILFERKNL